MPGIRYIISDCHLGKTILCLIGGQELIFLALIILLLFGGKKIPELMKGLGKGGKSFKDGMNGIDETVEETVNPENKKSDTEK